MIEGAEPRRNRPGGGEEVVRRCQGGSPLQEPLPAHADREFRRKVLGTDQGRPLRRAAKPRGEGGKHLWGAERQACGNQQEPQGLAAPGGERGHRLTTPLHECR